MLRVLLLSLMSSTCYFAIAADHGDVPPLPESVPSSQLQWSIQKLDTLGRVLYIAAHPDDENTSLISYLSLGAKYDAAYLSLTRGDGGQNLIGAELRDELGVIRTQELLAARRIDGGRQYFSRAKDFGFSKHPDETLKIWDKEAVLSDVVWVIREFQPDVIVTRFGPEPGVTHGHHTASCLLALEAFEAAADPTRFPEQLERFEPWQAKRVVWNIGWWYFRNSGQDFNESEYGAVDVGGYEPLLGKSFNEVASVSRSQHRSQGFGARIERGSRKEFFKDLAGEPMAGDLMSGVSTDWSRVEGSEVIEAKLSDLKESFDPANPSASLPEMFALRSALEAKSEEVWAVRKRAELDRIIAGSLGLDVKLLANRPSYQAGDRLNVTVEAINRSDRNVAIRSVRRGAAAIAESFGLPGNGRIEKLVTIEIGDDPGSAQPYWLVKEGGLGMFELDDSSLIGRAENEPPLSVELTLDVEGEELLFSAPVAYREVDPAKGESIKQVVPLPLASVSFATPVALFPNGATKTLEVEVAAFAKDVSGVVEISAPTGWKVEPRSVIVESIAASGTQRYSFTVTAPKVTGVAKIGAKFTSEDGVVVEQGLEEIRYEHISDQYVFKEASVRAVALSVDRRGSRVAYLPGAGDSMPEAIREIGYEVDLLSLSDVTAERLAGYDAFVFGIRAYNTVDGIDLVMPEVFEFVKQGGTAIVQYNTSHRLKTEQLAPYRLSLSRDRVTDEFAEMRVLAPGHPALNTPNKIVAEDFEGWTQERGLYFPNSWDDAFVPLFSVNDAGEPGREGSLLVAEYGEGHFVYSGLSWFRQMPAGVPGAYRIFANLLSLGN